MDKNLVKICKNHDCSVIFGTTTDELKSNIVKIISKSRSKTR
jgi:hypothetical protein